MGQARQRRRRARLPARQRAQRKTIATFPLAKGGTLSSAAASGAADDRTFVVSAAPTQGAAGAPNAPHACDTPFLTGNGQAVVCGNSTYSPSGKRLSAVWLAYPLATPTRPRLIGSVQEPQGVSSFNGSIAVEWTNPSGTKVIGSWNPAVELPRNGEEVTNYEGVIENGKVKPFPRIPRPMVAW